MDLETFELLLTSQGQLALRAATELQPTEAKFLACFERLRKSHPPSLAKAAIETAILRQLARSKFHEADRLYFTREAMEQASSETVATHRTRRFQAYPRVADLCCGIGADAMALASLELQVLAIDRDPLRARMAEVNLHATGHSDRAQVQCADVCHDPLPQCDAFFCDPARRSGEKRFRSLGDYEPSPQAVLDRFPRDFPAGFKLAPAVPWQDLEEFPGEVEFLSVNGELKECMLWLGPLATFRRRATVLPAGATLAADTPAPHPPIALTGNYLFDPDPSITRAGLVTQLAGELHATMLDPELAFLVASSHRDTPFARVYEIDAWMPFHLKNLQAALRERGIGRVTIIKRGSAISAEELQTRLKLKGSEARFLLLTRHQQKPIVIIARKC